MKLTVYYDGQFWIGIVEEVIREKLKASRHVFGSEPNDTEILEFVQRRILHITNKVSQEVNLKVQKEQRVNPKRLARQVANEMKKKGISPHAQESLKLEYEKRKKEKQTFSRQKREELKERKREIKFQKAKEKHRGR